MLGLWLKKECIWVFFVHDENLCALFFFFGYVCLILESVESIYNKK